MTFQLVFKKDSDVEVLEAELTEKGYKFVVDDEVILLAIREVNDEKHIATT